MMSKVQRKARVSDANGGGQVGFFTSLYSLYYQAFDLRWHIARSFLRESLSPYRDTKLIWLWAILTPIVPISAYTFLKVALNAFPDSDGIHPAVYVAIGITVWFFLRDLTFGAVSGLGRNKSMLAQSRFPMIGTIFSSYGMVIFDTIIRLIVCAIVIALLGSFSWLGLLYGFTLFIVGAMMAHGFSLILAVLWAGSPDIKNLADILFRYAFFVSNVLFALPRDGWASWLYKLNPFAILIENIRQFVIMGKPRSWTEVAIIALLSVVIFVIGSRLFYVSQSRIRATLV